jgi:opacity protein-like surface antigen
MKTLTSMIAAAALLSSLSAASAQTTRARGEMGLQGEGYSRVQTQRMDRDSDGSMYDSRSTTGVAPSDVSHGQPNEQNQQEERDFLGRTGGNIQHPAR